MDTGTSFLTVPQSLFMVFLSSLADAEECVLALDINLWLCPCKYRKSNEPLRLRVSPTMEFILHASDIFTPLNLTFERLTSSNTHSAATEEMCVLEVMPTGDDLPFLLGDTFLRKVVAVFDYKRGRIGIA